MIIDVVRQYLIAGPALDIFDPDRLWCKLGKFGVAGERNMQLGDAPSGLRKITQIGALIPAFAGLFAQHALLVDEAIEVRGGHVPGVALVGDEGVDGAHGAVAVAVD